MIKVSDLRLLVKEEGGIHFKMWVDYYAEIVPSSWSWKRPLQRWWVEMHGLYDENYNQVPVGENEWLVPYHYWMNDFSTFSLRRAMTKAYEMIEKMQEDDEAGEVKNWPWPSKI